MGKFIHKILFFLAVATITSSCLSAQALVDHSDIKHKPERIDWLVKPINAKAQVLKSNSRPEIILSNGLLKRAFRTTPNLACIDYTNLTNSRQHIRSVREEARIAINGKEYKVGGQTGQKENAYLLTEWLADFKSTENSFQYISYVVKELSTSIKWKNRFWAPDNTPTSGKLISFFFKPGTAELHGLEVVVNYELYDGLPLIVKYVTVKNNSNKAYKIEKVVNEVLAMVEEESAVEGSLEQMKKPQGIYFETNYAFNNSMRYTMSDQTLHWKADPNYTSQVHYRLQTPCLLEIYLEHAPGILLKPGDSLFSVRTHELLMNTDDREERGLSVRRMYRAVAPWVTANPIFMHLISKNDDQVRTAIEQCAATGYEALILSFGSNINMEDTSHLNIQRWKSLALYAHNKNIKIGGYSLFSSRKISDEDDVIDPKTGKPGGAFFGGHAPCFGSKWGLAYRDKIKSFLRLTGFDIWENDGPYPGDLCASVNHPGHKDLDDSQWRQIEIQKELYKSLNESGVYINSPDWYFLDGSNKIGLGYREKNFSLPRENQKILNRQNIYDGTWEKTPSMGWGFVPLTEYHGGGTEATLEPLSQHLEDYEQLMMQYYGAGVQAFYRGPRLYDTEETKKVVIKVIDWYKKYREILNSDIIHLRRPNGSDWDGILHVNPALMQKGLMMLYNPTKSSISRTIKLPLYYTGLTKVTRVSEKEGRAKKYKLNRDYSIEFSFTLPPQGYSWYVIQ